MKNKWEKFIRLCWKKAKKKRIFIKMLNIMPRTLFQWQNYMYSIRRNECH